MRTGVIQRTTGWVFLPSSVDFMIIWGGVFAMVIWDPYSTQLGAVTPKLLWDTHYFNTQLWWLCLLSIPFSRLERRWKRSSQKMAIGTLGMLGESTTVNIYIYLYIYIHLYIGHIGLVNILRKKQDDSRHCPNDICWGGIGCPGKGFRRKTTSKKQTDRCLFKGSWHWHAFCFGMLNFVSGKVLLIRYVLPRLGWFAFCF